MSQEIDSQSGNTGNRVEELFPGRTSLLASEVAELLHCTQQHVLNLCDSGDLVSIDIRTGQQSRTSKKKKARSQRRCLRIPVSSYTQFVERRSI